MPTGLVEKMYQTKRDGNGPAQARWAVDIVRAFLRHLVNEGATEKTIRVYCHRVAEVAEYGAKAAGFCFTRYGIDPLAAVSDVVVNAGGGEFAAVGWPATLERIRGKQAHWHKKQRERPSGG